MLGRSRDAATIADLLGAMADSLGSDATVLEQPSSLRTEDALPHADNAPAGPCEMATGVPVYGDASAPPSPQPRPTLMQHVAPSLRLPPPLASGSSVSGELAAPTLMDMIQRTVDREQSVVKPKPPVGEAYTAIASALVEADRPPPAPDCPPPATQRAALLADAFRDDSDDGPSFSRKVGADFMAKPRIKVKKDIGQKVCGQHSSKELVIVVAGQGTIECTCRRQALGKSDAKTDVYKWSFKKKQILNLGIQAGDNLRFSQVSTADGYTFRLRVQQNDSAASNSTTSISTKSTRWEAEQWDELSNRQEAPFTSQQLSAIAKLDKDVAKSFLTAPSCMVSTAFGRAILGQRSFRCFKISFSDPVQKLTHTIPAKVMVRQSHYYLSMRKRDIEPLKLNVGDRIQYQYKPCAKSLEFEATICRFDTSAGQPASKRQRRLKNSASSALGAAGAGATGKQGAVAPVVRDTIVDAKCPFSKTVTAHFLSSGRCKLNTLVGQQLCGDLGTVAIAFTVEEPLYLAGVCVKGSVYFEPGRPRRPGEKVYNLTLHKRDIERLGIVVGSTMVFSPWSPVLPSGSRAADGSVTHRMGLVIY